MSLAIISTHPIQYHAPLYREVEKSFGIPVTAIYGSDFSIAGYHDKGFNAAFSWDTDLLSGYNSVFLSKTSRGGARSAEGVSARGLGEALKKAGPKAVMIIGYSGRFYQAALWKAWRAEYPVIFRSETTDHANARGPLKRWIRDNALKYVYKRCEKLLYIGDRSHRHFKRLGVLDEKLIFSPYSVDKDMFEHDDKIKKNLRASTRNELGISDRDITVLFSGKLIYKKGADLLPDVVKEMSIKDFKRIKILFLGSGELENKLKKMCETTPKIKTHFLGFKNQKELSRYYHAADLLVLPSRHGETWGLVVNEALHHGLPCVVSEGVGCAPDLIEPGVTGEVCKINSVSSLAQAMKRAFGLVGKAGIAQKCREKVDGYTIENAARGINEAYCSITGKGK